MYHRRNLLIWKLVFCLGACSLLVIDVLAFHRNNFSDDSYSQTNNPNKSSRYLDVSSSVISDGLSLSLALPKSVSHEFRFNQGSNFEVVLGVASLNTYRDQDASFHLSLLTRRFDHEVPPPPPPPPAGRPPHGPPPPPPPPPPGRPPR